MTAHDDVRAHYRTRLEQHRLPDGAMAMPTQSLTRPGLLAALKPVFATLAIWK